MNEYPTVITNGTPDDPRYTIVREDKTAADFAAEEFDEAAINLQAPGLCTDLAQTWNRFAELYAKDMAMILERRQSGKITEDEYQTVFRHDYPACRLDPNVGRIRIGKYLKSRTLLSGESFLRGDSLL